MQISSIRHLLSQLRAHGAYRNSRLQSFRHKGFHGGLQFKADERVLALRDKLLYCDYLDHEKTKWGYVKRKEIQRKQLELEKKMYYEKIAYEPAISVTVSENRTEEQDQPENNTNENVEERKPLHMPYARVDSYEMTDSKQNTDTNTNVLNEEYKRLYEKYLETKGIASSGEHLLKFTDFVKNDSSSNTPKGELWKIPRNWMSDYEEFDDALLDDDEYKYYGTPDPNSHVSNIPCGGCGALLHCKDPSIPGYLPSELFTQKNDDDLKSMVCQRCHFLKFYNASLEVKVSIEDYPKLLRIIRTRKCAIILIIDLTDFPCSIWPDLRSIMHPLTPIYLVGNKVDLLPRDSLYCLENIKQLLVDSVIDVTGVTRESIMHVQLTSAKTGYGIEQLINKLSHIWRCKGDVYLIGCTNVGKSSMFNTLLNSDFCKVQAADLVQRATVSAWPGTTLNLLKFPIMNMGGVKGYLRVQRLVNERFYRSEIAKYRDYQFKMTRNIEFATLEDHVGRTFSKPSLEEANIDPFSEKSHKFLLKKVVLDETQPEFEKSRWCYDTPGTIQKDQILDLLTTDELLLTLPQQIMSPRTFILKPNETVFLAGLGRLDYLEGEYFMRCTLFASKNLPVTVCHTIDADEVYDRLLETEAFVVPVNDPERLKLWPKFKSKELKVTGVKGESAADVILSSPGWIALTPQENDTVSLRAWTPEGRGIHLRSPALLKRSVRLAGAKVPGTPMYTRGREVYVRC